MSIIKKTERQIHIPAAIVALASAIYATVLYTIVPGGKQAGVGWWIIAGLGFLLARILRRRSLVCGTR